MENQEILNQESEIQETFTLDEVNQIKSELNEKYLRLFAEFENYKKRIHKEKEDIKLNTKISMLSSILDLDSDLAIALKNDKSENAGLKLIISKLEKFLNLQGVESIQTEIYDVDVHEVISVIEIGEDKIIDVVSKGYTINGKPFRYPKIILGK